MARGRRPEKLEVLVDDERFVVVAKPAGMLTVPPRSNAAAACLLTELRDLWRAEDPEAGAPIACHRLDRETSGCLVVARDREAAREIMEAFRKRRVEKSYLALVVGAPQPPAGGIEFRVKPDRRRAGAMLVVEKGGKPCSSTYETLETFRGIAWVRVKPTTGRTHEVRIGLRQLGTPCAVDRLYGSEEPLYLSQWKRGYRKGRGREELPLIARVALHAETLAFPRPGGAEDGELVRAEAPLPRDLETTLRQLRRYAAPGTL